MADTIISNQKAILISAIVAALAFLALCLFWLNQAVSIKINDTSTAPTRTEKTKDTAAAPTASNPSTEVVAIQPDAASSAPEAGTDQPASSPADGSNQVEVPIEPLPPVQAQDIPKTFQEVRDLLAQQNAAAAKAKLAAARVNAMQQDDRREEFLRLEKLTEMMRQFNDKMAQGMRAFKLGETHYGEERLVIHAAEKGRLDVFYDGQHHDYKAEEMYKYPDFDMADFIFAKKFVKNPRNKILYGAYLLMTPYGDKKQAKRMWDEANADEKCVPELHADLDLVYPEIPLHPQSKERPNRRSPAELMEMDPENLTNLVEEDEPEKPAEKPAQAEAKPETPAPAPAPAQPEAKPAEPAQAEAKEDPAAEQKRTAELQKTFTDIRRAIASRNIAASKKLVDAATANAKTDDEKAELDRLAALSSYMESFLRWVAQSMGTFEVMAAFPVGNEEIAIVESEPGKLIVRVRGQNKTYTLNNLNPRLVDFLLQDQLNLSADNLLLYGTYYAMDPQGDRNRARKIWGDAKRMGADIDALLPELDIPLPAGINSAANLGDGADGTQKAVIPPLPTMTQENPPDEASRSAALESIKKFYAKDYTRTDERGRDVLAAKMLRRAKSGRKTTSAEAYVMLNEAARLAMAAHRYEYAYEAYMLLQYRFKTETYDTRMKLIQDADPDIRGKVSKNGIASSAMHLAGEAYHTGKKEDALQLLEIAKKNGAPSAQVKKYHAEISKMPNSAPKAKAQDVQE